MPFYDYVCDNCGYTFEQLQSIKDEHLTDCPICGKSSLRRKIGKGGIIEFHGKGFYVNDYPKDEE